MTRYMTPKGREVFSRMPMSEADLVEHDKLVDWLEVQPEPDENFEDPDSDGQWFNLQYYRRR